MDSHKLIRHYFECLSRLGEQMHFDLIKIKKSGVETLSYNHLNFDGVSALCEHLQTLPGKKELPAGRAQNPPSFFKRLWYLFQWWTQVSFRRFYVPKGKSHGEFLFGYRVLKVTDQQNLNARILHALHRALQTETDSLWMLPVSLHEKVEVGMPPKNNVSFVDVRVSRKDSLQEIRERIEGDLKKGVHWGTLYSLLTPKLLGEGLFKKVFPHLSLILRRTGTFTNIGHWKIEGLEEGEAWGIKATVVPLNPLGASALQVNDHLTIGLQLHPALGLSESELQKILDRWQEALGHSAPTL